MTNHNQMVHNQGHKSGSKAWYAVLILMIAYISSIIDRVVMSFLVGPIKHSFAVNDFELALLTGLAFTLFYTIVGLPFGRLVDTTHRRNLIIIGITLWSIATIMCGVVRNYGELFLMRVLVGVGEATLGPAAYSLIADMFKPERRATAFSVYSMGITVGSGIAVLVAGLASEITQAQSVLTVPYVGNVYSWQYVFGLVGVPGLAIALLLFTIHEPLRPERSQKQSWKEFRLLLSKHRKTFTYYLIGFGFFSMYNQGVGFWLPEFFVRSFAWSKADIGQMQGAITALAGTVGLIVGAWFTNILFRRGYTDAPLRTLISSAAGVLTFGSLVSLAPSGQIAALMLIPATFCGFAPYGAAVTGLQNLVANTARGQIGAVFLFIINLIGGGLGPLFTSFCTNYVFMNDSALRYSILLTTLTGMSLALACYIPACRHYRHSVQQSRVSSES